MKKLSTPAYKSEAEKEERAGNLIEGSPVVIPSSLAKPENVGRTLQAISTGEHALLTVTKDSPNKGKKYGVHFVTSEGSEFAVFLPATPEKGDKFNYQLHIEQVQKRNAAAGVMIDSYRIESIEKVETKEKNKRAEGVIKR